MKAGLGPAAMALASAGIVWGWLSLPSTLSQAGHAPPHCCQGRTSRQGLLAAVMVASAGLDSAKIRSSLEMTFCKSPRHQ